jgi:hypothetical protein
LVRYLNIFWLIKKKTSISTNSRILYHLGENLVDLFPVSTIQKQKNMAELVGGAFLSSFFQVALEKLSYNDFIDYFRRRKLDDTLLEKLQVTLHSINYVLEEAETKKYQNTYVKK